MNKDVFLSILAMDSYNRGPTPGLLNLPVSGKLGDAKILYDSVSKIGTIPNDIFGFYSIAYQWGNKAVVSYRGTNFDFGIELVKDVLNGWSTFTGIGTNSQFGFARTFHNTVTSTDPATGLTIDPANVILTGHSLGGALAGYVGALAKTGETVVIDPIPYGQIAWLGAISEAFEATLIVLGITATSNPLVGIGTLVLGQLIPGTAIPIETFVETFDREINARIPDLARIRGYSLEGEIAASITSTEGTVGSQLTLAGFTSFGLALFTKSVIDALLEDRSHIKTLSNYGSSDSLGSIALHSPALATIVLYGEKQWDGSSDWQTSLKYVLPATTDDALAESLGRSQTGAPGTGTGFAPPGEQLARIIAYSAIDEGETRPFGDTGIYALFDDASDLGRALNGAAPDSLLAASDQVGRLIAEYAGLLATRKVLASDATIPKAKDGILSYSVDARSGGKTLLIDFRDATWTVGESGKLHIIETRDDVVGAFLNSGAIGISLVGRITDWYTRNVTSSTGSFVHDIDRIAIAISADTRLAVAPGTGVLLSVLNDGGSRLNASIGTDFVIGGSGSDTINGGDGQDILIGGDGNDTLNGGATADFIWGGAGADTFVGGNGNDTIYAGDADLRVDGGTGSDLIVITAEGGSDLFDFFHTTSVFGGSGHDKIVVEEGAIGTARINGGRGNDLIEIDATIADTVIDFAAGDGRDLITLGVGASAPIINLTGTTSSAVSYRFDVQGIPVDLGRALDGVAEEWRATGDLLISIAGGGSIVVTGVTARIAYKSVGDPNGPQFWPGERTNQVLGFALEVGVSIDGQLQRLRAERYNASDPFDNPLNFSLGAIGSQFYAAASDFEAAHGGAAQFSASFAAMSPESFLSVDSLSSSSEARSFGDAVADDFMLTDSFAGLILSPQENVEAQSGAVNANFIQFSQSSVMLADLLDLGVVPLAIPAAFAGAQPPVWDALESRGDFLMQHIAPADLIPGF